MGEAIRRRRRAAKQSQARLAKRSSLYWTYLSEIDNARINPTSTTLRESANGLGVRTSELVAEAEDVARD